MTAVLARHASDRPRASTSASIERLHAALLWLIGFSSGFVLIEPAPYEVLVAVAMIVFAVTGLTIRAAHLPLMFLLALHNLGYVIAVTPVLGLEGTTMWTAVSCFLAVTTLFFALALAENTERRLDLLLKGYVASAVIVSLIGILAYFRLLPSSETFLLYSRVKSTFKDPNVFGPFLVLPGLIALQAMMLGRLRAAVWGTAVMLVIAAGLFLSFSRGAWAHFAVSAAVLLALSYVASRSAAARLRIVLFGIAAAVALAAFVLALLSFEQVSALFQQRASLVQDYDAGRTGRFGRHLLGALMIFDHPIGIGPLQFSKYFPEDPHNSFLDAFMAGGWLGGFTFATLVLLTLAAGLRCVLVPTPWQASYIAVYAAFAGEVGESYVIDVQHWRHYFLLMGVVWGLIVATRSWSRRSGRPAAPAALGCGGAPASL